MDCGLGGICGGCPWRGRPFADQVSEWSGALDAALGLQGLPPVGWPVEGVGEDGLRDRVDFGQWREEGRVRWGLRRLDGGGWVEVQTCPALSPGLAAWRADLARDPPPLPGRAGLRLRVAPGGARGVWVDAANVDVKALLDEARWLERMAAAGVVVEVGQRRKEAVRLDGAWKLRERAPRPWWRTWLRGGAPVDVYGRVGGFTQPSLEANQVLVRRVLEAVGPMEDGTPWVEVGCGAGNLTLPLASAGARVTAVDADEGALEALGCGVRAAGLDGRVCAVRAGLGGQRLAAAIPGHRGALVDPPRSGLGDVVAALDPLDALVYVACGTEALARDAAALIGRGWRFDGGWGVAQFPQTPHVEWVVRLVR